MNEDPLDFKSLKARGCVIRSEPDSCSKPLVYTAF